MCGTEGVTVWLDDKRDNGKSSRNGGKWAKEGDKDTDYWSTFRTHRRADKATLHKKEERKKAWNKENEQRGNFEEVRGGGAHGGEEYHEEYMIYTHKNTRWKLVNAGKADGGLSHRIIMEMNGCPGGL